MFLKTNTELCARPWEQDECKAAPIHRQRFSRRKNRVDMVGVGGARLKENRSDSGLAVARVKARNHIGRDGLKILGILACRERIFWMERANGPLLTGSHHHGTLPASQNIDFLAFHCL